MNRALRKVRLVLALPSPFARGGLFAATVGPAVAVGLAAVLAVLPSPAAAQPLSPGEQLVYTVSWAVIPGAGRITVEGRAGRDGTGPTLEVQTMTETRGVAHLFLPFEAWANSVYSPHTHRLIRIEESSKTRGKSAAHTLVFDYARHQASYRDNLSHAPPETLAVPEGDPADLINCLLDARAWNLRPGQARDALVFFEDDMYLLTVHAVSYEDVDTGFGSARALLLEPRMEKTPPKGMFKRGSTVRVWIGHQLGRELPLRFQVQFKVGSGVATLTGYRPGAAVAPAAPAPAPGDRK